VTAFNLDYRVHIIIILIRYHSR